MAGTLVDTRWNPARAIEEAAAKIGLEIPANAGDTYAGTYMQRLPVFHAANLTSDAAVEAFWIQLDADWLAQLGLDPRLAPELYEAGCNLLFGPNSEVFRPFADSESTLKRLNMAGIRLGVISNWDNSLNRVLDMFGWRGCFEFVIPSLVFGHEKPDPRIFESAISRLQVPTDAILHVGDNPIDDLQGARESGMRAELVDRGRTTNVAPFIRSLEYLEEAYEWIG